MPTPPASPPEPFVNLIANGDFFRWDDGQLAPRHWTIGQGFSPDELPFELERVSDPAYAGGFAARETWTENDTALAFQRVFGQTLDNLKPHTTYRLTVSAHNESENDVIVSAFEMTDFEPGYVGSGTPGERLALEIVRLGPTDGLTQFTGTFATKDIGTIKLGARIEGEDPELPGSVVWDYWELNEVK